MNMDDLLFGMDNLEGYKRGEQPEGWLNDHAEIMQARCRAQSAKLRKLLASGTPASVERLNKPI